MIDGQFYSHELPPKKLLSTVLLSDSFETVGKNDDRSAEEMLNSALTHLSLKDLSPEDEIMLRAITDRFGYRAAIAAITESNEYRAKPKAPDLDNDEV